MRMIVLGAALALAMGVTGVAAAVNGPATDQTRGRHVHYHHHYHYHHSNISTGHYRHHLHPHTTATAH
jgi:hypothetical protein